MIIVKSRQEFLQALELPKYSYCAEIGVYQGDFSQLIYETINPLYLFLIDPFEFNDTKYENGLTTAYSTIDDYRKVKTRFGQQIRYGQVIIKKDYSHNIVHTFANNFFDFIYLDGSHLYNDTKLDLKQWFPKVKKGGIIAGHDYIQHEDFGVIKAVDEFCQTYKFEMILFNKNGGDYALRRK